MRAPRSFDKSDVIRPTQQHPTRKTKDGSGCFEGALRVSMNCRRSGSINNNNNNNNNNNDDDDDNNNNNRENAPDVLRLADMT
jgi:hypothetical protein